MRSPSARRARKRFEAVCHPLQKEAAATRTRWTLWLVLLTFVAATSFAQRLPARNRIGHPPALPLLANPASVAMLGPQASWRIAARADVPAQETVMLPLNSGTSLISIPVETQSRVLSDLLPNLPPGSHVWIWNATAQRFVEGVDQELPDGQGAVVYVPVPIVVTITGRANVSARTPVDLKSGWNLVGVPYEESLLRSAQTVYAATVPLGFEDAISQDDLQEPVYGLTASGYTEVGPDDSFQPMNAYWIYSTDSDLLEFKSPLLQSTTIPVWAADKIGGVLFNFAASQLLKQLLPDPNQSVIDQLNVISGKLDDIAATQTYMIGQLNGLEKRLQVDLTQIKLDIGDKPITDVENKLKTQYDDTTNDFHSLMWFEQAHEKATATPPDNSNLKQVNDTNKGAFAKEILDTDYRTQFQNVYAQVMKNGDGVLENYATKIVLSGLAQSKGLNAEEQYAALQNYFARIIGVQVKCMVLITNIYPVLADHPEYGAFNASSGEQWRQQIYIPAMNQEFNRFRAAVDRLLVGNIIVGGGASSPNVPSVFGDIILPEADLLVLRGLGQGAGVRVRVLASPDMNADNTYTIFNNGNAFRTLDRTDSGSWSTVAGVTPYDSWQIDPTGVPKFVVRNDWIVWKPAGVITDRIDTLAIRDRWGISVSNRPGMYMRRVDDGTGTFVSFGSITLVVRATATTILNLRLDNYVTSNCPGTSSPKNNVIVSPSPDFSNLCSYLKNKPTFIFAVYANQSFIYGGSSDQRSRFGMGFVWRMASPRSGAYGNVSIWLREGSGQSGAPWVVFLQKNDPGAYDTTATVTWKAGQKYDLTLNLVPRPGTGANTVTRTAIDLWGFAPPSQ